MLDTWTLRVLVEVGERGSFSAAAESLSMTQPAVSRQISGLERRLGVRLFKRLPRGVRATAPGNAAVELAREALDRIHAIESRMAAFTDLEGGQLRLSAFPSVNTFFVPDAIRRFRTAHPAVELRLLRVEPSDALAAIRAGDVDLALLTEWNLYTDPPAAKYAADRSTMPRQPLDDVEMVPLLDEELHVALPAGHRLARRRRIPLIELREETWIEGAHPDCLGPIAPLTRALGADPRIGFACDDWNGKQALVAAGAGIMLVPTLAGSTMRRDVVLRATLPVLPTRRLYAATALAPFRPPAAAAMLDLLGTAAARHRPGPS